MVPATNVGATSRLKSGVLIHEELLNFGERRIRKVCCLGNRWFEHSGLPLPVGLNVARRSLGLPTIQLLENLVHASMAWALAHPDPLRPDFHHPESFVLEIRH